MTKVNERAALAQRIGKIHIHRNVAAVKLSWAHHAIDWRDASAPAVTPRLRRHQSTQFNGIPASNCVRLWFIILR